MWKKTGAKHALITEDNGGQELVEELTEGMQGGVSVVFQPGAVAHHRGRGGAERRQSRGVRVRLPHKQSD